MTVYDQTDIPAAYDRGRDHGPQVLRLWLDALTSHLGHNPAWIVDLGCGTGRFSDALAVHYDADVLGLDPSLRMISQAYAKLRAGRVHYHLAGAEAMPLRARSMDVVFMSMSLHHFADRMLAARECRRVLRQDGVVFIRTGTREQIPSYPYYPFFPASHRVLEEMLPAADQIREWFESAGFQFTAVDLIAQTIAPGWEAYADKLEANADSVLARLDRYDFENGISAVREHAIRAPDEDIVELIDLFVLRAP
jgi:ubiquinone/menaquinone biosynthesis C-methylase UbiE